MPKTQEEWRWLEHLTSDEVLVRIGVINAEICWEVGENSCPPIVGELAELADEVIVLMLTSLRRVIEEKRWTGVRPLDLFEGAYGELSGPSWEVVVGRFRNTKSVVEAYRKGAGKEKKELTNILMARGFM